MCDYFRFFWRAIILLRGRNRGLRRLFLSLCGTALAAPASALVGPAREAPQFAPYVVMVMYRSGGDTSFCTASVITSNIVLTAAHCVSDLSDTRVFYRGGLGKLALFDVTTVAINPDYKPNAWRQHFVSIDLALLRLKEPLPSSFQPVELADFGPIATGQRLRIAGFGRADEDVSGTSGILRVGILSVTGPKSKLLAFLVDPNGFGLGGCTGDSGAPIFAIDRPLLVAVAIRAKGKGGYSCGASTEAVQIGPQMPWIHEILRAWGTTRGMAQ
jgi:hypothetical protein